MKIESFYDYLEYKRQFRPVTIGNYKRILNKVFRDLETTDIKPKMAEEWILNMQKRNLSASHINNTAAILTCYDKFSGIELNLIRVKKPKPLIKDTLTEGEVARIIAACSNSREKAIISLLAYSGIRASELCNLKVEDVDLDNGVVHIINGKGGKDGISYIARECCKMIAEYIKEYETNPHLFRHSLATNLVKKGANILTVQKQLRHENLETTQIYIRSFPERVQDEYAFFKPNYV